MCPNYVLMHVPPRSTALALAFSEWIYSAFYSFHVCVANLLFFTSSYVIRDLIVGAASNAIFLGYPFTRQLSRMMCRMRKNVLWMQQPAIQTLSPSPRDSSRLDTTAHSIRFGKGRCPQNRTYRFPQGRIATPTYLPPWQTSVSHYWVVYIKPISTMTL